MILIAIVKRGDPAHPALIEMGLDTVKALEHADADCAVVLADEKGVSIAFHSAIADACREAAALLAHRDDVAYFDVGAGMRLDVIPDEATP